MPKNGCSFCGGEKTVSTDLWDNDTALSTKPCPECRPGDHKKFYALGLDGKRKEFMASKTQAR